MSEKKPNITIRSKKNTHQPIKQTQNIKKRFSKSGRDLLKRHRNRNK